MRCGKCSSVFDGVGNILAEEAVAALLDEPSPQLGLFEAREQPQVPVPGGDQAAPAPQEPAWHAPSDRDYEPTRQAALPEEEPPVTIITETAGLGAKSRPETVVVPAFLAIEPQRSAHLIAWSLLTVISLGALVLQAGLHFRTEIGVLLPQSRPSLETACEFLGCEVQLPRRADLLSIDSSDLQADNQRAGVIVLNALLRNRAPFAQEFPDLELTLTDQGERPVIRKVLKPRDYLQERRVVPTQGMGGGAEEAVRMFLDTGGILATGYQLFLFYPCPPASSSPYWQLSYPSRCQESGNK